ncbi:veficolin-1-like [Branchiostoma lanceolatum]|uniref:veficolin-1-like n=1 Tax=Branchiostoma lanceolatum TaxID=7740 RepID=UPI003456B2C9
MCDFLSPYRVSGELDQYRVRVYGYTGTAGDEIIHDNNGQRFSTVDRDNDEWSGGHCSQVYGQAGWWFGACSQSVLNGRYLGNCGNSCPAYQGVVWRRWGGSYESMKSVSVKIRPTAEPQDVGESKYLRVLMLQVLGFTDCADYYASGQTTSGVYTLGSGVQAYCDMDTAGGGWTVIQRRQDGSVPFNRTWEEYKQGFGDKDGEYWLGNDNIHLLTMQKDCALRIDISDWQGESRYVEYSSFRLVLHLLGRQHI